MDTFNLYLDCPSLFQCVVTLDGVSYRDASARIVATTDDVNLLFNGTISGQGECSVPVPPVSAVYADGVTGILRLEVIADDYYFNALEMPFVVGYAMKATATDAVQIEMPSIEEERQEELPVIDPIHVEAVTVEETPVTHADNVLRPKERKVKNKPAITVDMVGAIVKGMSKK